MPGALDNLVNLFLQSRNASALDHSGWVGGGVFCDMAQKQKMMTLKHKVLNFTCASRGIQKHDPRFRLLTQSD